jgi:hypothetical protein
LNRVSCLFLGQPRQKSSCLYFAVRRHMPTYSLFVGWDKVSPTFCSGST